MRRYTNTSFLMQIEQNTKKNGTRTYSAVGSKKKYPSVTTVISKVATDKRSLMKWREEVGPEEALKITKHSSSLGTKVHMCNELYFTKEKPIPDTYDDEVLSRHNLFLPFLKHVKPLHIEEAIIWETLCQDQYIGFGGTPDLVGLFEKPEMLGLASNTPITFLADYKNWRSSKTADRLIDKYLQLAAYTAAVNNSRPQNSKIEHGFILGTTKRKLHIYHLSLRELKWYWVWFFEALKKYYELETPFDRKRFQEFSVGYILEGTDENGKKIWGQRDENYLGEKLTLISD